MEDPYELAYTEAVRALTQQRDAFESLRGRAGVLLSGAAIASSLLGGQAFDAGRLGAPGWLAVAAFACLGALAAAILWPTGESSGGSSAGQLIGSHLDVDDPTPAALIRRELALDIEAVYLDNQRAYGRLVAQLRAAALLLNAEVIGWIVELAQKSA